MKRKLFSAMATLLVCLSFSFVQAQTWVGETVADGKDFYLYNEGSGQFLTPGNNWGCKASFGDIGITIGFSGSGNTYTLSTASAYAGKYIAHAGWLDGANNIWTVTNVGTDEAPVYTIANGTDYFGYDGSTTVVATKLTDGTTDNAKWLLVSKEQRIKALASATSTNGLDATFCIKDPDFSRAIDVTWEGASPKNSNVKDVHESGYSGDYTDQAGSLTNNNYVSEKWNITGSFDVYQILTGLPNGEYELTCQGFYRYGTWEQATASRTADTEQLNAVLYASTTAGEVVDTLMSIFDDATTNQLLDNHKFNVETVHGWIPDSKRVSSSYFANGNYSANKVKVTVINGELRLGIKKTTGRADDWTVFDTFRLTYLGFDNSVALAALQVLIDVVATEGYVDKLLDDNLKASLEIAVAAANTAIETQQGLTEALDALNQAIADAKVSIADAADLSLSALTVNGEAFTLKEGQTSYTYPLVPGTTVDDIVVAATATSENTTVVSTQAEAIPGNASIQLTSRDGSTVTYSISFAINLLYGWNVGTTPSDAGWDGPEGNEITWGADNNNQVSWRRNVPAPVNNGNNPILYTRLRDTKLNFPINGTLATQKVYQLSGKIWRRNGGGNARANFNFAVATDIATTSPLLAHTESVVGNNVITNFTTSFVISSTTVTDPVFLVWDVTDVVGNWENAAIYDLALVETGDAYAVTFDTNGGSDVPTQYLMNDGEAVATAPEAPTKQGYVFEGWYSDAAFSSAYDFSTAVSGSITLYANWTKDSETSINTPSADTFSVIAVDKGVKVISTEAQTINIYAITGQLVKQVSLTATEITIPLNKGMYIVNGKKAIVK